MIRWAKRMSRLVVSSRVMAQGQPVSKVAEQALIARLAALALAALPSMALADTWFECRAISIVESNNRVAVQCSNTVDANGDDVFYVAISNADAPKTARFVSMASTAVVSGQIFYALIPDSAATNTNGCLSTNCRTPWSWGLKNEN